MPYQKRDQRISFGQARSILARCLSLKCPACGRASIVHGLFRIKDHCSACEALFKREEGFFVGAILINVVTTEAAILLASLILLLILGATYQLVLTVLFVLAVSFPVLFYHHSWALWLGFDHFVEGLPRRKDYQK